MDISDYTSPELRNEFEQRPEIGRTFGSEVDKAFRCYEGLIADLQEGMSNPADRDAVPEALHMVMGAIMARAFLVGLRLGRENPKE